MNTVTVYIDNALLETFTTEVEDKPTIWKWVFRQLNDRGITGLVEIVVTTPLGE